MHAGHRNTVFNRVVKDPFAGLYSLGRIHIVSDRHFGQRELDAGEMNEVADDQQLFSRNDT